MYLELEVVDGDFMIIYASCLGLVEMEEKHDVNDRMLSC